jgi:hypothetical protein
MSKHFRNSTSQRVLFCAVAAVLIFGVFQTAKSMPSPQDSQDYGSPKLVTSKLPDGKVGTPYIITIQAVGGQTPWNFSAKGQPKGLSMDTVRGPNTSDTLHGTPTEAGDFNVELTVADSADPPKTASATVKLHIAP